MLCFPVEEELTLKAHSLLEVLIILNMRLSFPIGMVICLLFLYYLGTVHNECQTCAVHLLSSFNSRMKLL